MAKQEVIMTEAARAIATRAANEDRAKYQARIMRQLDRFYRMGQEAGQERQKRLMEGQGLDVEEEPMPNEPPRMNRRDLLSIMVAVLYDRHPPSVAIQMARDIVKQVDKSYGIPLDRIAELFMTRTDS